MENILDTTKTVALLEPTEKVKPRKRATCRFCGTKRKEGVEWFDAEFCSGKCKNQDNPTDAPPVPELIMPKTRTGECKFCGSLLSTVVGS